MSDLASLVARHYVSEDASHLTVPATHGMLERGHTATGPQSEDRRRRPRESSRSADTASSRRREITASNNAVQPRSFTWLASMLVRTTRRT